MRERRGKKLARLVDDGHHHVTRSDTKFPVRNAHSAAVRAGAVDINLLLLDGQPAAFMLYNYHYQGHVLGLRMGFDGECVPRRRRQRVVQSLVRDSYERGDKLLDLGPGYEPYKRHWDRPLASSYRYDSQLSRRPRSGQALHIKRRVWGWIGKRRQALNGRQQRTTEYGPRYA